MPTQPRPLYPQGKGPWYVLDMRLGGPQRRSGRRGGEKNSQPRRESNPKTPIVQPVASHYTDWAITEVPNIVRLEVRTKYGSTALKEKYHFEDLGRSGTI
jgi:hypothetical protein